MRNLKMKPLAIAMALVLPVSAQAQTSSDAGTTPTEEVIVTGSFRAALADALNVKRDAVGVQDSIMSDDMGKLPDLNLADALQRVPGVAITREAGEGRQIALRGLGPNFNRVTMNGMESSSATDGLAGGNNTGRAFDFNVFASELFNRIDVHKTQEARAERGMAGAVDLYTAKPFDFDGFAASYSAQAQYNDLTEEVTPRGAFMVSNTFADDTFGALLSVAYSEREARLEGHTTVRWQQNDSVHGEAVFPRIPRASTRATSQERLGITGSFQYQPSANFGLTADLMVAQLDATREMYEYQAGMHTGPSNIETQSAYINADTGGVPEVVAASLENVKVMSEAVRQQATTDFHQFTLNGDWQINDNWGMTALLGTSKSDFDKPVEDTLAIESPEGRFAYSYVRGLDPRQSSGMQSGGARDMSVPSLWFDASPDSDSWDTTNPSDYEIGLFRLRKASIVNQNQTAKVDFNYSVDDRSSLRFGADFRSFEMDYVDARNTKQENSLDGEPIDGLTQTMPLSFGSGLGAPAAFPTSETWMSPNYDAMLERYRDRTSPTLTADNTLMYGSAVLFVEGHRTFGVGEEIASAYAQLDFESEALGLPMRGNVGVRIARTDTTSTVFDQLNFNEDLAAYEASLTQALIDQTEGSFSDQRPDPMEYFIDETGNYTDVLPSLNLAIDITDTVIGRFSFGRSMTRAGLSSLASAVDISPQTRNVSTGNPGLKPYRADQIDLGLEWYFSDDAVIAGTIFWKDLTNDIINETEERPLTEAEVDRYNLEHWRNEGRFNMEDTFYFNRPGNAVGNDLLGAEFVYQQPFTNLPGILSNTGVNFAYTYIDAEQVYEFKGETMNHTRPDISKNSYNLTAYYEEDVWGVRASYNWRGDYATSLGNRNGLNTETRKAAGYLDLSAYWDVHENVTVSFEAVNALDTFEDQVVGLDNELPVNYLHSGRQFMLGLRGSF